MPAYEIALPIGASDILLTKRGKEYPILIDTDTFDRTGEDGDTPILALFGGDEFVGEVLEGQWKKGWTTDMDADQAFTAILDQAGKLELEGEADVAGTWGYGWINSQLPLPLMDETELILALEVPVDDTGAVANRDINQEFNLNSAKIGGADRPSVQSNLLRIFIDVDETGLLMWFQKKIATATTTLFDGSTYDDATARATGTGVATIWRIVFHDGDPSGTSPSDDRHIHVYVKQSDTIDIAEQADENELTTSPYDISDLLFDIGFPNFQIGSQSTTYFDSGGEAKSNYIRVFYPDFNVKYDVTEANRILQEVELWDGDPDSGGVKVYDVDHAFTNAVYIQNGLIQAQFPNTTGGLMVYGFFSAAWNQLNSEFFPVLNDDNQDLEYVSVQSIQSISPEKIEIIVRFKDDATEDDDFFMEALVTLNRGQFLVTVSPTEVYPIQSDYDWEMDKLTNDRFNYVGDDGVGDDDLNVGHTNATLSDNYGITFDDAGDAVLVFWGSNKIPDTSRRASTAGWQVINDILNADILDLKFYLGYTPFSLVTNLFEEAEDATLAGGATSVADGAASGGNAALLNAQDERVLWSVQAGTNKPEGRYLAVFRIRDTNQIVGDVQVRASNTTDVSDRSEENTPTYLTVTATYAYYALVFDITAQDVTDGDQIELRVWKINADANEIYVDYFLVVPIGDGKSWPQDVAHNALRDINKERRLYNR